MADVAAVEIGSLDMLILTKRTIFKKKRSKPTKQSSVSDCMSILAAEWVVIKCDQIVVLTYPPGLDVQPAWQPRKTDDSNLQGGRSWSREGHREDLT